MTGAAERRLLDIVSPVTAVAVAVALGMALLAVSGYPAWQTFANIGRAAFADGYGFGQVVRSATLLTFTGLAVAVAFQAGLFNVGVEGQMTVAAAAAGVAGAMLKRLAPETLAAVPGGVWTVSLVMAAMAAGAVWALIPAALKAFTGAHEVIVTIMMNFVAASLAVWLLRGPDDGGFGVAGTTHTATVPKAVRIPLLQDSFAALQGSRASWAAAAALAACVATWWFLYRTRSGFGLRASGLNPEAARLAGVMPSRTLFAAMGLSGALGALGAADSVLGDKGYFEEGFSSGAGFLGIAVALLAKNHPLRIPVAAGLFAVLSYGKVGAAGDVPKDIVEVLQALLILSVVCGDKLIARGLRTWQKRRAAENRTSAAEAPAV